MPRESSLVPALAGEPAEWSVADYLLAHVVDGINSVLYAYVASHSKHKPPAPKPVPRPRTHAEIARKPLSGRSEVSAFFKTINNA